MSEKKYSEDYEKLLIYKQSLLSEDFQQIKNETVAFFFKKYEKNIMDQYRIFRKVFYKEVSYEGKIDYEEAEAFKIEIPSYEAFNKEIKEKYIPQALDSFKPEKIKNIKSYHFVTYLFYYLRHAVRNLSGKWIKNMSTPSEVYSHASFEEEIINEAEKERIRKKYAELKKQLNPLEDQILSFLIEEKKQKEMILINKETGKPYTKGYISKLVKKVRAKMKKLLEEQ